MPLQEDFDSILSTYDPSSINESSPLIEDEIEDRRPPPPKDDYQKVYLVFFLLGMGTLLPWNFFISINSFWDYKFR
jgi:hypothetical protein